MTEQGIAVSARAAGQRRVRVTAGLAELEVWLADQVRTGLAHTDRSAAGFAGIAARMVDAQAPAIAAALRRLPASTAGRTDWPELVLREYAGLHLLGTAHRRLAELSPELRDTVRAHIGYPISKDAVRANPPVRDEWQVLGRRTTEEDRIHTRRIWLSGRRTRRWAVLIDHAFGAPDFAAAPDTGLLFDADLHFYPGAAPLRALIGTEYAARQPFTTVPMADASIAAALTAQARALGADPWLRSWPMLLAAVIPCRHENGWYVAESDGMGLPLAVTDEPWRLLGVSGGHTVMLLGEWTSEGLLPLSVMTSGEVIELAPCDPTGPPVPNRPVAQGPHGAELVATALLGTARRFRVPAATPGPTSVSAPASNTTPAPATMEAAPETLASSNGPAGPHCIPGGGDPARRLLESAALDTLFARGGIAARPVRIPDAAEPDSRRRLPEPAAARLAELLRRCSGFLTEWFEAAAPQDFRAPDVLCADLLDYATGDQELREPLLRLAGARGRWLARQHPEWREMLRESSFADLSEQRWRIGGPRERRAWLAELRATDPEGALAALTAAWPRESGPHKAELLAVLAHRLAAADEPLLESALDDRRADVRRTAAELLALLPDSALARRMVERARTWLRVGHRIGIELPERLDDAARRDGIRDRAVEFAYRWDGAPDPAAGWVRQLVAATGLDHWTERFGTPRAAVTAKLPNRFRQPVLDGWVAAALAHRDQAWAGALFDSGIPSEVAMLRRRELFALLPAEERVRRLLRLDGSWLSELESLLPAMGHPWPEPLARHLILLLFERARAAERRPDAYGAGPDAHRSLLAAASAHLPFGAAAALDSVVRRCGDPRWQSAFDRLATDLAHRSTMLEELL
ncbi:SWIM zinc finger family protein [Nocardia panacis]|uniref:SWIM zinc finger family protein n=1 Tax=Nocardia panacis TaxID=2340916 RepID=A0A3A4KX17_9NOCA|nr:DUF5691 domain-containing protein [Nocardia panacis]RJO79981.1 SWIM zinc finger family protein [Nocardia panacis]